MLRRSILASAALALTLAPIAAQAAPEAASRTDAGIEDSEHFRGTTMYIVGAIVLAALIWGGIELLGDDEPSSP